MVYAGAKLRLRAVAKSKECVECGHIYILPPILFYL